MRSEESEKNWLAVFEIRIAVLTSWQRRGKQTMTGHTFLGSPSHKDGDCMSGSFLTWALHLRSPYLSEINDLGMHEKLKILNLKIKNKIKK